MKEHNGSAIKLVKDEMETWLFLDAGRKVGGLGIKTSCVLDLTCLLPAALQGFYSRVHLWPNLPSGKLAESPAPGGVLHGGS